MGGAFVSGVKGRNKPDLGWGVLDAGDVWKTVGVGVLDTRREAYCGDIELRGGFEDRVWLKRWHLVTLKNIQYNSSLTKTSHC